MRVSGAVLYAGLVREVGSAAPSGVRFVADEPPVHQNSRSIVLKTLGAQLALFMEEPEGRQNIGVVVRFLLMVAGVMALFTVLFHLLMAWEGQSHSWLTGFYWTLVTMSTLGFGDIVFQTDLGRAFSMVVLFTGVVLLLVLLPFVFIRYFYAPWFEAQVQIRAPRDLKAEVKNHVIVVSWDILGPGLLEHFRAHEIPYVFLEPDPERATRLHGEGIQVLAADIDSEETYNKIRASEARLVVANMDDRTNTNVILTVRAVAPHVPVLAVASSEDAVDIMEMAGASTVAPLRRQLGEQLANRINAGHAQTHQIGRFEDLVIAEFPVQNTPLVGKTIRETRLRASVQVNVVGVWDGGTLQPPSPDYVLTEHCLPVVVGSKERMEELDELLYIYDTNWNPVIVIGGGKVGRAATRSLRGKGVKVHLVERNPELAALWKDVPDQMFVGDAANRDILEDAGIHDAPAVVLTTNDDATNVFLAVYCRRLNKDLRIVSRVTHERNVPSIRRAGTDLVLSYASLAVQTISAMARNRPLIVLGEGVELMEEDVPASLDGQTLAESGIGEKTGLTVVAVRPEEGKISGSPGADFTLQSGAQLFLIGQAEGLVKFHKYFGTAASNGS